MRVEWIVVIGLGLLIPGLIVVAISTMDHVVERTKDNTLIVTRGSFLEAFGLLLLVLGLLPLSFLMMVSGWFWVLEVPYQLVVGWALYLQRVLPRINPDAGSVVSGGACVAVVAFGSHLFLRWLASTVSRTWPLKRTLRLLLLLVMMFVVGLAFTGLVQQTGWLIRAPEPLVKDTRGLS
jgi:hypothetical protein